VDVQYFLPALIAPMRERSRRELNYSPNDFVVLLIGNDWRNKGLSTLLAAVSQCRDLPIRLLVVGQDDPRYFRARAQELLIANHVQFVSPASDVRHFYAAADVLAAPSLEDSFNLPVLEAMSCGLPVIVSPHAGISHWLTNDRDTILLKDPENIAELTGVLRLMATDSAKRKAISENALQTAAKFSWDAHARELRRLLVSAAGKKARYKKT